jgi:hypothetical protein
LAEYHALSKLKEFLYAELCTFHIECAILKQAFSKYTSNLGNPDFNTLKQVRKSIIQTVKRLDEINGKLEKENNRLKLNIIDLNDALGVCYVSSIAKWQEVQSP